MISAQWLAGFFDGEGCFSITVSGSNRRCLLRLTISNTNDDLLRHIQDDYGGRLAIQKHSKHPEWKPSCSLIWANRQAEDLLDKIGDFIILKRAQFDLAREFLALHHGVGSDRYDLGSTTGIAIKHRKYIRKVKPLVLQQEADIKQRMHLLNKKGRVA